MSRVVHAALLLLAPVPSSADPIQEGLGWLQIMSFAAHQADYSGTFVYQYGNHVETSRITHITDGDGEHGRLESLDGPHREVIRHNDHVWRYNDDGQVTMELRQAGREFPALLPQQISLLRENYEIRAAEEDRLAGFHAHALVFRPRDNLRYTHKMWADSVSGLLLKSEVQDERGRVIEQYAFTQLRIGGDIDRKWLEEIRASWRKGGDLHPHHGAHHVYEKSSEGRSPVGRAAGELPSIASGWQVDALPVGFRKIAEVSRRLHGKDAQATQLVFSDGLAGISVFIERLDGDEDGRMGLSSQGLIQVYRKLQGNYLVTVVGEVPPRTVIQVADSVRNGGGR